MRVKPRWQMVQRKCLSDAGFMAGGEGGGTSGGSSTSWRVWGRGRGKIWGRNEKKAAGGEPVGEEQEARQLAVEAPVALGCSRREDGLGTERDVWQ